MSLAFSIFVVVGVIFTPTPVESATKNLPNGYHNDMELRSACIDRDGNPCVGCLGRQGKCNGKPYEQCKKAFDIGATWCEDPAYSIISSTHACGHVNGGYPARCFKFNEPNCKQLCTDFYGCIAYGIGYNNCQMYTSTGSCPTGFHFSSGKIAKQSSDLTASILPNWNCMAKDVRHWISISNRQPIGHLWYTGSDHKCSTRHGQCYWSDLQMAKDECDTWASCKYLYQSDKHLPATHGNPVYWARTNGGSEYEEGAVLWKFTAVAPTCEDNELNQEEEQVDCGGPNCPACTDKVWKKLCTSCDVTASNGQKYIDKTSLKDCKKRCEEDSGCKGIEYGKASGRHPGVCLHIYGGKITHKPDPTYNGYILQD